MIRHLILGLLHDGRVRHGYQLKLEYETRSGEGISTGSIYRELGHLAEGRLVAASGTRSNGDARRIPYTITAAGRELFERWLSEEPEATDPLWERLLFADRIPAAMRMRVFQAWEERLWERARDLGRSFEEAKRQHGANGGFDPRPALLHRHMRDVSAELELLAQIRGQLDRRSASAAAKP